MLPQRGDGRHSNWRYRLRPLRVTQVATARRLVRVLGVLRTQGPYPRRHPPESSSVAGGGCSPRAPAWVLRRQSRVGKASAGSGRCQPISRTASNDAFIQAY